MDFREAFCHGGHAGLMKHRPGPWRMRLLLVNICTFGSKNIILLLMQSSQCLWLKYTAQPFLKVTYTPPLKQRKAKQFSKNKILFCQKKEKKKNSETHVKSMEFQLKCVFVYKRMQHLFWIFKFYTRIPLTDIRAPKLKHLQLVVTSF